jgi:bisphosphoglycerate-dependent phosphoglycerate mutase
MAEFKKLSEAIELMNAIKDTFRDTKHINQETLKQRYEQAQVVIEYLNDTRYAALKEKKKRERAALTYEEKILLWKRRAEQFGYKEVDARVSYEEQQIDNLTF